MNTAPFWLFALAAAIGVAIASPTSQQRLWQVSKHLGSARKQQLFGPEATWGSWEPVTDRVRGGISTAALSIQPSSSSAIFTGLLDTATLGGAGFASVRTNLTQTDFSAFTGLEITLLNADGRTYALNLFNELGGKRPDGRRESSIEFKYNIKTAKTNNNLQIFELPFDAFVPYYRGRPTNDGTKLDSSNVKSLSWMIQSYFDEQKGPFEVTLLSIDAY